MIAPNLICCRKNRDAVGKYCRSAAGARDPNAPRFGNCRCSAHNNAMMTNIIRPSFLLWFAFVCILFAFPLPSLAQQSPLEAAIGDYLQTETQGLPGKVTFSIGQLDARTRLKSCDAFQPFLPTGSRLWGRTTIGVRCLGPSEWTIYARVQISVAGKYLVSARAMPAGYLIESQDIVIRNGDLGKLPTNILTDEAQAIGRKVKNGFAAGQVLRSDQLAVEWAILQGQSVRIVSNGPGFSVSTEGTAINNASAGQVVQVRTASGQTIRGIAQEDGSVDVTR